MDDSGMIIAQMGTRNRSVMAAVHGMPCAIQLIVHVFQFFSVVELL
jgi:hypothetical protein